MSFKDVIVYVGNDPQNKARLDFTIEMARSQGAKLTGLHVIVPTNMQTEYPMVSADQILATRMQAKRETAENLKAMFEDCVRDQELNSEWRCVEDMDIVGQIALNARYADVVVLGQKDPQTDGMSLRRDEVILSAGRPVLLYPFVGTYPYKDVGRRVVVAWDASLPATRAVHDALPLLREADRVVVLTINPRHGMNGHGGFDGGGLCRHLARHGIKAEAKQTFTEDVEVGSFLLSCVAGEGADLLVMGAYGHRRMRELILGGVTREILGHMTVPVLMSH